MVPVPSSTGGGFSEGTVVLPSSPHSLSLDPLAASHTQAYVV